MKSVNMDEILLKLMKNVFKWMKNVIILENLMS
jgi:hypothetical protein